jgi:hypothetical protein
MPSPSFPSDPLLPGEANLVEDYDRDAPDQPAVG